MYKYNDRHHRTKRCARNIVRKTPSNTYTIFHLENSILILKRPKGKGVVKWIPNQNETFSTCSPIMNTSFDINCMTSSLIFENENYNVWVKSKSAHPPRATPGHLTRVKSQIGENLTLVQVPTPRAFDTGKKRRSTLYIPIICIICICQTSK